MSAESEEQAVGGEPAMDEENRKRCREMFEKVTEYLNGELAGEPA